MYSKNQLKQSLHTINPKNDEATLKPRFNSIAQNNRDWLYKKTKDAMMDKTGTIEGLDYMLAEYISFYVANQLPSDLDIQNFGKTEPKTAELPPKMDKSSLVVLFIFVMCAFMVFTLLLLA